MRLGQRATWLLATPWRLVVLVAIVAALPILVIGELAAADTTARQQAAASDTALRFRTGRTTPLIDALDRDDRGAVQTELQEMHRFVDPAVTWLLVIDPASRLIAADPFASGLTGTDLSARIAPARGSTSIEVSDAFAWYDSLLGTTSVATSVITPIGTTPPLNYRLVAVVRLATLAGRSATQLRTAYQDAYFVDRGGHLALRASNAFSPDDLAYRDLSGSPAVASLVSGVADPLQPGRVVRAAAPVPDIGWSVLVVDAPSAIDADLDAALGQQRALRLGLAGVFLVGAALVASASATAIRRRRETTEALEQQTAVGEVLKTISRSAFELQAVFDVVVENATKLCRGDWGYLFRRESDVFRIVSSFGGTAELIEYERTHPTPLSRNTLIGRVALDRTVVHLPDLFEDPTYDWPSNRAAGVHTVLGVPIFKDDEVVGAIGVARNEKRPFSDAEIRLVRTFADQAAIAMENVRLFNETKAALERQTAISEILRVIASSPSDEKPVLDTIAKSATRFCGANDAVVFLVNGDHFDMAAHHGSVPLWRDRIAQADVPSMTVSRETLVGRAVLDRRTMTITDALGPEADPFPHARHSARELGQRAILATPLIREDRPIGAIVLQKTEPIAFTTNQISLVEAFADQAVIAIENVRLFNETKEALAQQTETADVLDVVSKSAFAIEPVFQAIVDRAARLFVPPPFAIILQRDGTDLIVRALFPVE